MNAFSSNPFVLPGMGQSGEASSNPLLASMEMMRQAFSGLTGAGGLNAGLQMTRAMDPDELEKKITDLRAVENWLKLNLSMLSSTIQGMEVQLATIVTLKSYVSGMNTAAEQSPLPAADTNVTEAAEAWWDMLQKQFGQVAQATAATMAASTAATQSVVNAASPAAVKKKPAAKKTTPRRASKTSKPSTTKP